MNDVVNFVNSIADNTYKKSIAASLVDQKEYLPKVEAESKQDTPYHLKE